jgi:hypothetical protein
MERGRGEREREGGEERRREAICTSFFIFLV